MEILDPDLWNDDGTPKRPSKEYMERLDAAQRDVGIAAETGDPALAVSYLSYARIKREAKAARSPEVGDIVHAWTGETCRAAIVMETDSFGDGALLRVHVPKYRGPAEGMFVDLETPHDEDKEFSDTWHWPCGEGR